MPITFLQLAERIINEEGRPLSAGEIWQIAQEKGYDRELATQGKTPQVTLGARLYVEARDNPRGTFVAVGARPKRFITRALYENLGNDFDHIQLAPEPKKLGYSEKDLHPFLVYYSFYYLKAYLKTIRHHTSRKSEFGEWVHPDIVGCYFPFNDWEDETVELSSMMGDTAVRLFSFELKRDLSFANLRESFFQAVSNSSWAHEGYLVAAAIDSGEEFRAELGRLSESFGIGVIELDLSDPDASSIIFPARSKESVDWEMVNKLGRMNADFREFLKRIKTDIKSREVRKEFYDPVPTREELVREARQG
ncbi:MAG: HTH domain-containing protein [Thermoflexales bacterium]